MDDIFIRELEEKFGDTGYVFWFKTLELIASQGENGIVYIPQTQYRQIIHSHRMDHLRRLYAFATERGRLEVTELTDGRLKIECRKFAEYCDNYTKYDGLSSKRLQRQKEMSIKPIEVEEEEREKKKRKSFVPPNPEEASTYFVDTLSLPPDEALAFIDHYTANGWVQGRQGKPVKDWQAAARNWKRNYTKFNGKGNANGYRQAPAGSQVARATFKHGPEELKRLDALKATLDERDRKRGERSGLG